MNTIRLIVAMLGLVSMPSQASIIDTNPRNLERALRNLNYLPDCANWDNPVRLFQEYAGMVDSQDVVEQFLGDGYKVRSSIRKIRVTNFTNYAPLRIVHDAWTTIYTEGITNITPGASLTITGASGPLAVLNGYYKNGVAVFNNDRDGFLLKQDTSDLPCDPLTGLIDVPEGVFVEAVYKVHALMDYHEFVACCQALDRAIGNSRLAIWRFPFTKELSAQVVDTFEEARKSQNELQEQRIIDSTHLNSLYHNFVVITGYDAATLVNSPYPLNGDNELLEYDVALGNYLVNVHNLYYSPQGLALIAPASIIDGVNQATPPPGYASLGDFSYTYGNINGYYFGEVNPKLTAGKKVGYVYMASCNFRKGAFSEMIKWFRAKAIDSLIIDFAANFGDNQVALSELAECMPTIQVLTPISLEETVFQDFGLLPMKRPPLHGWSAQALDFNNPSSWRYSALEEAISNLLIVR